MAKESLDRILAAEAEARELLKEVKEESKNMVQNASKSSEEKAEKRLKELEEKEKMKDEALRAELEPKIKNILDAAKQEGEKLEQLAQERLPQAVKFLKGKVFE